MFWIFSYNQTFKLIFLKMAFLDIDCSGFKPSICNNNRYKKYYYSIV